MNFMTRIAIFAAFLVAFVTVTSVRAADRTFVAVASYSNRPEVVEKEGKRAATILSEHRITHGLGDRAHEGG